MSSFLRSLCHMMSTEVAVSGGQTIHEQNERKHQIVLDESGLRPLNLKIIPPDKTNTEGCLSCQMALNELQLLRKRLEAECELKSLDRNERREAERHPANLFSNLKVVSTKEDELFGVIEDLKLSLEKAKDRQFNLQEQLIMERVLRIQAIRLTEELQQKLTGQVFCSHERQEYAPAQETKQFGSNDEVDRKTEPSHETTSLLQSLTSIAGKMDEAYAELDFVCSRCRRKEERQAHQQPLRSIDRPLRRRTADDDRVTNSFPSRAISKAKNERIKEVEVEGQTLSLDLHQQQISDLVNRQGSVVASDEIVTAAHTHVTETQPPVEGTVKSSAKSSKEELRDIVPKEMSTEVAGESAVSLDTEPNEQMISAPMQDSPLPSDNLKQSKQSEIAISVDGNTKVPDAKLSDSSSSMSSKFQSNEKHKKSELQTGTKKSAKESNKGKTTVTVSSRGSFTTYSGSNLSLWMQFGNENEPETIIAKQIKPSRHQKQKQTYRTFIIEATSLGSSENQVKQTNFRSHKEFVFKKLKDGDFVASENGVGKEIRETPDNGIDRQSAMSDVDIVKIWKHNANLMQKDTLTCKVDSQKSLTSNSNQSSSSSKSMSNQSAIEKHSASNFPRNKPQTLGEMAPEKQAKQAANLTQFEAPVIGIGNPDDIQVVLHTVNECCSFQIPASSTNSPNMERQVDSINPVNILTPKSSKQSATVIAEKPNRDAEKETIDLVNSSTDVQTTDADSHFSHYREYRTYLDTLAEKLQIRESHGSTSRYAADKGRPEKSTLLIEPPLCKSTDLEPTEDISGIEHPTEKERINAPISLSKFHFISDEAMLTYISGIRTNLHNKYTNLNVSSGQTMDLISARSAGPLSEEEIISDKQQSISSEEKAELTSKETQPEKSFAIVPPDDDIARGVEPVCHSESPNDRPAVVQTDGTVPMPLGTKEQQLLAVENAKLISKDIRHHYIRLRRPSSDAIEDMNSSAANQEQRKILKLSEVGKTDPKSNLSPVFQSLKVPLEVKSESSRDIASDLVQVLNAPQKLMGPVGKSSSIPGTPSPNNLISSVADHGLTSDCRETMRKCDCQSHRFDCRSDTQGEGTQNESNKQVPGVVE